ncbi:MAG TPA: winged helix-turn-helix transcriptional regulator [Candidatus Thermoplasmatota archaeon]|nr:winged helix-turn-helix transcriptional regulator [Candidatus Thermoplasmatota archaeon]
MGFLALGILLVPAAAAWAPMQLPDLGPKPDQPRTDVGPVESPADTGALDGVFADLGFAGGFAIGLGVAFLVGLLLTAAVMGGTRFVTSENVLDNEARRQIFTYIKDNPGVHLRAAAQALSLSTTNVLWHLRKLESANLVNSKKFEGYKVFYPSEGGVESRRRAIASSVLRNQYARAILEFVVGNPSAHQREIARALGVNHGTVRWHLRKLNEAGLLLQIKRETSSMYYVSELGTQALGGWQKPTVPPETQPEPAAPAA